MNQNDSILGAMGNLTVIRRAIEKAENRNTAIPNNKIAIDAGLIFQAICLLIGLAMLVYEFASGFEMTKIMMLSVNDTESGMFGLAQVALTMLTLVICLYFLAWRAAHHSGQSLDDYLVRNFQYLNNLSIVSDLLVKFVPLSLLVLVGHAEFIPPLLSLYIADYLIQGRFFNLPTRPALLLGLVSVVVVFIQYQTKTVQLAWPLLHFSVVTAISVFYLYNAKRKAIVVTSEGE